jgi:TonB-linked SusC/RagA family outer membrane protein
MKKTKRLLETVQHSYCFLQMLRIMKLTIVLLLITALHVFSSDSYAQSKKLKLDLGETTVEQVLNAIEDQSEFYFLFNQKLVDVDRKVNLQTMNDQKIADVLAQLFEDTGIDFIVMDRQIVLSPSEYLSEAKSKLQPIQITGRVTDSEGNPLPGVNVQIQGSTVGAITNPQGEYQIEVGSPSDILVFSFVGMTTQEIMIGNQRQINVTLAEEVYALGEVVAVGYGTQRKSDLTASISQVAGEDIERSTVSNVAMALQGRATGVEMLTDGRPGRAPSIRIRGVGTVNSTEPLIVLDDVFVGAEVLSKISPYEIQSIEVLKDAASTAIYGSRGANGVILITTKGGNYNQKITTRVNASWGMNQMIKKMPVLNGTDTYMLKRERYEMDGIPIAYPWTDNFYNAHRTDWQDEVFRNAFYQDYNIQITGGTERNRFAASINYRDEEGIPINTWYKRIGVNLKAGQKISDRIRTEQNIRVSWQKDKLYDEGTGTSTNLYAAYFYPPSIPVRWDESNVRPGQLVGDWGSGKESDEFGDMWNPVYLATDEWIYSTDLNALINLRGEIDILEGLTLVGTGSYTHSTQFDTYFNDVTPRQNRSINAPRLYEYNHSGGTMLGELYLRYNRNFGGHNVAATGGTTAQLNKCIGYSTMLGEGFASTLESQLVMDNADVVTAGGGRCQSVSLLSYFIRATYNFENRYYFSGIMRADGSSRFAEGNRWGYFPAVSAGWRISNEAFMNIDALSNLKLNAGWGQVGNQGVAPFQYLNIYSKDAKYIIGGNNVTGTRLSSFANPAITWETTTTLNILLESAFLDNRINLDLAYFDKMTTDMLLPSVKHYTSGTVELPDVNSGEMRNWGWEIELSHNNRIGDFGYNVGLNLTFLQNELTKLYGEGKYVEAGVSRTYEGQPIASFYGWKTGGIYQDQGQIDSDPNITNDPRRGNITPGDVIFLDMNGDGLVDADDRVQIGDGNPSALMGLYFNFSYKGWNLSGIFNGAYGHELYDNAMNRTMKAPETDGWHAKMIERWTGPGSTNTWPRMSTIEANQNYRYSELFLFSGDYTRLKDITLSYSFPASLMNKLKMGDTRIYVSGRNLLTFTKYEGVDPEETQRGNNFYRGIIENEWPQARTIIFGLDISF